MTQGLYNRLSTYSTDSITLPFRQHILSLLLTIVFRYFQNLDGLSDLSVYNIAWSCSCERLAWMVDVLDKNITLKGDLMCANEQGRFNTFNTVIICNESHFA